eukprot:scaffold28124_cov46-Phaeocystis_antarctica.AAC.1
MCDSFSLFARQPSGCASTEASHPGLEQAGSQAGLPLTRVRLGLGQSASARPLVRPALVHRPLAARRRAHRIPAGPSNPNPTPNPNPSRTP